MECNACTSRIRCVCVCVYIYIHICILWNICTLYTYITLIYWLTKHLAQENPPPSGLFLAKPRGCCWWHPSKFLCSHIHSWFYPQANLTGKILIDSGQMVSMRLLPVETVRRCISILNGLSVSSHMNGIFLAYLLVKLSSFQGTHHTVPKQFVSQTWFELAPRKVKRNQQEWVIACHSHSSPR